MSELVFPRTDDERVSVGEIEGAHLAGSGGRVARTAFPRELKRAGTSLGERTSDPGVRALAVPEGMPA